MMGFFWGDFSQDRRTFQVSDWVVTCSEPIEVDVELVPLNATIIPMKFHEIPMSCPLNADLEISDLEMHHNSFPQPSPHWCHRTHWDRHISGTFVCQPPYWTIIFTGLFQPVTSTFVGHNGAYLLILPANLPLYLPNLHQFTSVYLGCTEPLWIFLPVFTSQSSEAPWIEVTKVGLELRATKPCFSTGSVDLKGRDGWYVFSIIGEDVYLTI